MAAMKKTCLALLILPLLFGGIAHAQDNDDSDSAAALSFVVLKDYNGKQEKGGIELKADAEGKCYFDGIPYGRLRVQVLATGFQTFGQDYNIDQPKLTIIVKMQRPQGQYSIYTDKQNDEKKDEAPPSDGSAKPKQ